MRIAPSLVVCALVLGLGAARDAAAAPHDAQVWLDGLEARVAADLAAGKPLVVQVHVPLCSNEIIRCGNTKLGDGDHPAGNLYWATSEGFLGWFGRRGGGWKQVMASDGAAIGEPEVLDLRVWRRTVATPAAWRKAGAPKTYTMYVVAEAWRGVKIDDTLARYADDVYGVHAQSVTLPDGTVLAAGGDAQIVAWVGHNRLMDLDSFDWGAVRARGDDRVRGVIAIACHTAPYLQDTIPSAHQVPLLVTRDFLFASAAALEGGLVAFATGGDYAAVRNASARNYATSGHRDLKKIYGVFSNPADPRWGKPGYHAGVNAHAAQHKAAQTP